MRTLMQPLLCFGECLKGILAKRNISGSELARMMGYKSRNSIFRILEEDGGHGARQAFFDRLIGEDLLHLTQEERNYLSQALEISRIGISGFKNSWAMYNLLMETDEPRAFVKIGMISSDEENCGDILADILCQYEEVEILFIGCCMRWVFDDVHEHMVQYHAQDRCRITHFIYMDEGNAVSSIAAIQPIFYHPNYMAYCIEPGMFEPEKESLYRSNWVIMKCRDHSGEWHGQAFVLVERGKFCGMMRMEADEYRKLSEIFKRDQARMLPLKMNFNSNAMTDYLSYTQECLRLEQGRTSYTIKPDILLSCVQTENLVPMAREGFAGMADEAEVERLIEQMERVHRQRWENLFESRKTTHIIFSRRAMEEFAKTGKQSDHLYIFKPYSPQMCVEILGNLKKHEQKNPHFHVYFFADEEDMPLSETGLYEGVGTLVTQPSTHYDLSGGHCESIISGREFCRQYKLYYTQVLLEKCVCSKEETLRILDELIQMAREREVFPQ